MPKSHFLHQGALADSDGQVTSDVFAGEVDRVGKDAMHRVQNRSDSERDKGGVFCGKNDRGNLAVM